MSVSVTTDTASACDEIRALLVGGRVAEAERLASELVEDGHRDRTLLYLRAECAYARGDFAAAVLRFDDLRSSYPDHIFGYWGPARIARDKGDLESADLLYSELVSRFPDDVGALDEWANLAERRGDDAAVQQRRAQMRDAFPDHLPGYVAAARHLLDQGRTAEAEPLFADALRIAPDHLPALLGLADCASRSPERAAEAEQRWQAVRDAHPEAWEGVVAWPT